MREYIKDRTWFEAFFKLNEVRIIHTVVNVGNMVSSFKFLTGKTTYERKTYESEAKRTSVVGLMFLASFLILVY